MSRSLFALASLTLIGCIDAPVPISPLGGGPPTSSLAELGVFTSPPSAQIPTAEVIPYEVISPLYSDEARKRRFLWLPPGTHISDGQWQLPIGSVLVKTFSFPIDERDPSLGERLIETRFLVRTESGYTGSTYVWNDAQTDAIASGGQLDVPVHWIDLEGRTHDQIFHIPGTSNCQDCHQQRALGIRTAQLDLDGHWDDGTTNQLDHFVALGLLDARPTSSVTFVNPYDESMPLEGRARSYLDVNCGLCHAEGQSAAGTHVLWDFNHTAPSELPLCRPTGTVDGFNRVIVPGSPHASELIARMRSSDPYLRMPRGPSRLPDARALTVLEQWIGSMSGGCP